MNETELNLVKDFSKWCDKARLDAVAMLGESHS